MTDDLKFEESDSAPKWTDGKKSERIIGVWMSAEPDSKAMKAAIDSLVSHATSHRRKIKRAWRGAKGEHWVLLAELELPKA